MRAALVLAALVVAAPAAAEQFDIPWFEANAGQRAAWTRDCRNDYRLSPRICANAEAAESRAYAARLRARSDAVAGSLPPTLNTPLMQDTLKIACAQPPQDRGMLGRYCRRT
jgi:hypothetical protein